MLAAKYNHKDAEPKWQKTWYETGIYNWEEEMPREQTFVIDTPPPTVSGLLHMGHIFSYTQADFIARFQRMLGKTVFYPVGFDDNGLPTERLVEKVKKIRASNMPREEFIAVCREVVTEAEEEFRKVFKSIALSIDWRQEYQTISDQSTKLSQMSFLDLVDKNRAYRKSQPTLWDATDATALAQAEVVDIEMKSFMNEIIFKTENGEKIVISTTRPELLPACVAVFYHPDDSRYKHFKGQFAITPLFSIKVPIIADEKVDIEKGTGLVMCCTFGDVTDIDWWRNYNLPTRMILNKYGKIDNLDLMGSNDWQSLNLSQARSHIEQINGLKAKDARIKMIELLKESGDFVNQIEITHTVKCGERSGTPLEILVSSQWFIKLLDIKEELLNQAAKCAWHPNYMKIRLDHWIEGLKWDWCISRQRFFGVPFPVWYSKRKGEEGKAIFAHPDDLPVNPISSLPRGYSRDEVEPDYDVMDTWATSSISPQLNSQAINSKYAIDLNRHKKLYPADMRPQAHEIIRVWAFYTIIKSYLHEETIPWSNLMISGWCLAADKTKMSKSKGNVVTPIDLIEDKGADAIRYWAANSKLGADIAYSEEVFKLGNKLINKLWNAAKFTELQLNNLKITPTTIKEDSQKIFKPVDLWILSKLKKTVEKATEEFKKFEYCNAKTAIEDFFWNIYCDNYIEIVKTRSYDEQGIDQAGQTSALLTMYHVLKTLLKLFAPYLPHICEEIYASIYQDTKLLNQRGSWPNIDEHIADSNAETLGDYLVNVLNFVRKAKAEKQVSISSPIKTLHICREKATGNIDLVKDDLANVTKAEEISFSNNDNMLHTENELFKVSLE